MSELRDHKNMKIFFQVGFKSTNTSGNQVIGYCPFCGSVSGKSDIGKKESFYVNPDREGQVKWDCKICGLSGGYQTFIEEVYKTSQFLIDDPLFLKLSIKKQLKVKTFKKFGIGYINEQYVLPYWDENKFLITLKLYNIKTNILKNCAGGKLTLYNLWNYNHNCITVYNPEGEWDTMVMDEIAEGCSLTKYSILGSPGANNFQAIWSHYFKNKIYYNFFDNDYEKIINNRMVVGAGKQGQRKVKNILGLTTKESNYINWLSTFKNGFDVRDLYILRKKNCEKTLRNLINMMKNTPMKIVAPDGYDIPEDVQKKEDSAKPYEFTGVGLSIDQIYFKYQKWLYLQDLECLDIMFGTMVANRFQGDPIWLFLIASSGGTKSELIMSLDDAPLIHPLSSLTPNTLISGTTKQGGGDPSLIPRLDGKILTIKDFTVILDMIQQARDAIMSQLRDAYDGKCEKAYGTGLERHYESKFGMFCGATPNIGQFIEGGSAMGERFLSYYLYEDNSYKGNKMIMTKALDNFVGGEKDSMRDELKAIATEALNYDYGKTFPGLPDELREQLFALSQYTAIARGTVPRDKYTRKITRTALIEKPTRLVTQYAKLALGVTAFKRLDNATQKELNLVSKVALSTIPYHINKIMFFINNKNINGVYTDEDIARALHLPLDATSKYIEDMFHLSMLKKKKLSPMSTGYLLSKNIKNLLDIGNLYKRGSMQGVESKKKVQIAFKQMQKDKSKFIKKYNFKIERK